jgi:hypothetical protein
MCAGRCDVGFLFRVLQNRRRRIALRCLRTHHTMTLPDLAELVAERETSEELPDLPPGEVRDVYFSLYHTHVPMLVDGDLAWYEQGDDAVGIADSARSTLAEVRDAVDSLVRPPEA